GQYRSLSHTDTQTRRLGVGWVDGCGVWGAHAHIHTTAESHPNTRNTHIHTHAESHTHTQIHTIIHTHTQSYTHEHTYTHSHTFTHRHTQSHTYRDSRPDRMRLCT